MHKPFALPVLIAVASAGLWAGTQTAMHAGSIVPSAHASQPAGSFTAEIPAFVVTVRTTGGPVRHVAADVEATVTEPLASPADKDRLAEAVMFSAVKALGNPETASADGRAIAMNMMETASARLDGSVAGIHVRKLSVFDQATSAPKP